MAASINQSSLRRTLEDWLYFIRAESHILVERPSLLFQQAANQPDKCVAAMAARKLCDCGSANRPWIRWVNKPQHQDPCILTLAAHTKEVHACCYSPDGKHILSGSKDETLKLWDAETGLLVATLEGQTGGVTSCAYSQDAQRIVSGSEQGKLTIWDSQDFALLTTLSAHSHGAVTCTCSPDGVYIVSAGGSWNDHTIKIWDGHAHVELLRMNVPTEVVACSIGKDTSRLLSRHADDTVRVWDSRSGTLLATLRGLGWEAPCVDSIVYGEAERKGIRIWNGATGEIVATLHESGDQPRAAAYSSSYDRVALALLEKLQIWNAQTGTVITEIEQHTTDVTACCFSPDGRLILSAADHEPLRLWDCDTGALLATLTKCDAAVDEFCYSSSGRHIVARAGDGTISVLGTVDHLPLTSWKNHPSWRDAASAITREPNEQTRKVLSAALRTYSWDAPADSDLFRDPPNCTPSDGTLKVWDSVAGSLVAKFEARATRISACCYSSDGRRILIGSEAGLEVWDSETGDILENARGYFGDVMRARFSPVDQSVVCAGRWADILRVWDCEAGDTFLDLKGHSANVTDCCFSPDGRRILSASEDQTLIVWDKRRGVQLARLEGHTGKVTACCYSPDGDRILSGGEDQTLRIWDAESGALLQTIHCSAEPGTGYIWDSEEVTACCYSPNGRHFLSGSRSGAIKIWDETGNLLSTLRTNSGEVSACCYSPNGRRILAGSSDRTLKIWDVETRGLLKTLEGHTDTISSCCYSPDCRRILSGSWDGSLKIWDAEAGVQLGTLKHHGWAASTYDYSPEGPLLVTDSDFENHLSVRDESGAVLARLEGRAYSLNSCCYDPETRRIALTSFGGSGVFDADTCERLITLAENSDAEVACCFSLDGRQIITRSKDDSLTVWDAQIGESLGVLEGRCFWVAVGAGFYAPGPRLVTKASDGALAVFDAECGALVARFEQHEWPIRSGVYSPDGRLFAAVSTSAVKSGIEVRDTLTDSLRSGLAGHSDAITAACFSPDGTRLLTASKDRTLKVWDVEAGIPSASRARHSDEVITLRFAPDSHKLVSGSKDNTLKIWSAADGEVAATLKGHGKQITACSFSLDGKRLLSGSEDNQLILWDTETSSLLKTLSWHTSGIGACCYSPDGSRFVSGSTDGTLAIWDAESGSPLAKRDGRSGGIIASCYSADGTRIVAGHSGGALTVWDAATHRRVARLEQHRDAIDSCYYFPDGRRFVSASWDGTINVWDAADCRLLATLGEPPDEYSPFYLNKVSCSISPDGRRIVSGHWDGSVRLWNSRTGSLLGLIQGERPDWIVTGCWFSPDARYIVTTEGIPGATGELNVRDSDSGDSLGRFFTREAVEAAALTDDGHAVALGDRFGGVWLLRLMSFDTSPSLTTAVYLHRTSPAKSGISGLASRLFARAGLGGGKWRDHPEAKCRNCGKWFSPNDVVLLAIADVTRMADLAPDQSPCLMLPTEAWRDPRLLSQCSYCGTALRFNPFIVDNRSEKTS